MTSDTQPPRRIPPDMSAPTTSDGSYMDWGVIAAGTVLALAFAFLLISFGASLGLSLTSPYRGEGVSAAWVAIAAGIWFAWVMVSGFGAGGYLAGRMRRRAGDATHDEVNLRDGTHGLMVWATGALISTVIAASGLGGLLGAGATAVGAASDAASEAVSADYFANVMLRDSTPTSVDATDDTTEAVPMADGEAPPAPAQQQSATQGTQSIDPQTQQQIAAIIARSASQGEMQERDSTYLAQLVAGNSNLDAQGARARVDEVNAELAAARETALDAVESARVAGVVFGFIAAATLLIGALAAFFAAVAGGKHRDDGLGWNALTMRR